MAHICRALCGKSDPDTQDLGDGPDGGDDKEGKATTAPTRTAEPGLPAYEIPVGQALPSFEVVLKKPEKETPLGMTLIAVAQEMLMIDAIGQSEDGPTPVQVWNEQQKHLGGGRGKSQELKECQCVVGVNGVRGSVASMLEELSRDTTVRLSIVVPKILKVVITKPDGVQKVGLCVNRTTQPMTVESVEGGLVQTWNEEHPGGEVKDGDIVVKACGGAEKNDVLLDRIRSCETVDITILCAPREEEELKEGTELSL